jgi:UDP:flavonoid glycosyltransferase YjiC (YdhE family)
MRFLFLTWNGAGNQPPSVAIAQALKKRGHDVVFAGYADQQSYFAARGFRFVLLERSAAAWRDAPSDGMFAVKLHSVWASSDHFFDVAQLVAHEACDALVIDCLMFGALAAAERMQLPTVALIHSAPGALMPPGGKFESQLLGPVNDMRRKADLPAVGALWESWACVPALSNSIRELDPLAARAPKSFSYLGPLAGELSPSHWVSPWPETDRRSLVLVSFSTGPYWDQSSRITRTLDALSKGVCRVVVTAGSAEIDPATVPENAVVVRHIPHDEILPRAAVTVTHAGHGTVTTALKYGVPLLCLPNPAADQPILAAQVQDLGCGLMLDGETAAPSDIRTAIARLISEPFYAERARLIADVIGNSPGVSAAISRLEHLSQI